MFLILKVDGLDKVSGRKNAYKSDIRNSPHIIARYSHNYYISFSPQRFEPSRLAKDDTGCLLVFLSSLLQMPG